MRARLLKHRGRGRRHVFGRPATERWRFERRAKARQEHDPTHPDGELGGLCFERARGFGTDVFEQLRDDRPIGTLRPAADDAPVDPQGWTDVAVDVEQARAMWTEVPVAPGPAHRRRVEHRQERDIPKGSADAFDIGREHIAVVASSGTCLARSCVLRATPSANSASVLAWPAASQGFIALGSMSAANHFSSFFHSLAATSRAAPASKIGASSEGTTNNVRRIACSRQSIRVTYSASSSCAVVKPRTRAQSPRYGVSGSLECSAATLRTAVTTSGAVPVR